LSWRPWATRGVPLLWILYAGYLGLAAGLRLMLACYLLVIGAAALRLAALWPGPHTLAALHGATAAWVLAFVLYLWRFAPLLVRPRLRAPTAAATPVRSRP
ncbi:NnrS family protein, partial [Bordetella pertussis]|uniref:NnrS family protein n=1 Tax=Bordetella pertussis TaxID=520 RepID=UPI000B002A85